jgi:hypothetical protein
LGAGIGECISPFMVCRNLLRAIMAWSWEHQQRKTTAQANFRNKTKPAASTGQDIYYN